MQMARSDHFLKLLSAIYLITVTAPAFGASPGDAPNAQAVQDVASGKRTEANAAWWGFDPEDATDSLQAALDSGVKKLIVPYMGQPWIVRPVKLPSNLELVFEPGVVVLARKGEFRRGDDSLFHATDVTDVTIRGYGATLRMRKKDYQAPPYEKAEWRMGLFIRGCKRVLIEGLRIESSGGDGIYIGATSALPRCEDVVIRNVVCHDNHRQGISVIAAKNLLIENCVLSNTSGTAPRAGIDFEPNEDTQKLVNCVIRNCIMENNEGPGMLVALRPLSAPVSIRFVNCLVRGASTGMFIGVAENGGPEGVIEFIDCAAENTAHAAVRVYDRVTDRARVGFTNCSWSGAWREEPNNRERTPIELIPYLPQRARQLGGLNFVDCDLYEDCDRPVIAVIENRAKAHITGLTGRITLHSPHAARMDLGPDTGNISLQVLKARK